MTRYFSGYLDTDAEWLDRSQVRVLRPLWPRRCLITNKLLWIKPAVLIRRVIPGPGDYAVIDHWINHRAYTLQCLEGWD